MDRVGEELLDIALRRPNAEDVDLFGRSAINRFYYACFLSVREVVLFIHPSLRIKHKELPTNLRVTIAEIVRREITRLHKQTAISSGEAISYRVVLNKTIATLADTLEVAYKLRVVADYEPRKQATRAGGTLHLDGKSSTQARDWSRQASQNAARILKLWRDLGHH